MSGTTDPQFARVEEAFRANFDAGELGAACCVVVAGRTVVDLWGGWADEARTRAWRPDTLVNAYSVGKPIVALAVLQLVARGAIDLDVRLTRYWPESTAGADGATVRHALCHRAGVPAIREPLTNAQLWDWDTMAAAVARTDPWWVPGSRHVYHTNTYGFLVGELARRVSGTLPGDWLRAVAGPLDADVAWGVTPADLSRCADIAWDGPEPPPVDWSVIDGLPAEDAMVALGYVNPPGFSGIGVVNTDEWRRSQVPSTNLHATARGVARMYAALLGGSGLNGPLLDAGALAEATRVQSEGWCPVLGREVSFGLGFQVSRPDRPLGGPAGFGHYGTGGSLGFADPDVSVAFGYVMNAVKPRWQNERNRALVDALYACL